MALFTSRTEYIKEQISPQENKLRTAATELPCAQICTSNSVPCVIKHVLTTTTTSI